MTENGSKGKHHGLPEGSDPESPSEPGQEGREPEASDDGDSEGASGEATFPDLPSGEIQAEALSIIPDETSPEVKVALIELVDKEGERVLKAAQAALDSDYKQFKLQTDTTEKSASQDRNTLRLASVMDFAKWAVPAIFALVLAHWMVQFFRAGNVEAAKSIRELLLLMIGGALGWIARRSEG